ncbi:MAG: phenylalanine--tRNA ligase subunit beta [Bacteriovoracia bacterium]
MVFSYNWLKEYFEGDLPTAETVAELLTVHSFEIEGVEKKTFENNEIKEEGGDWLIDIDVLPNRAHDALCHYGMAREISVITGLKLKKVEEKIFPNLLSPEIKINVKEDFCRRYVGRQIKNVKVGESPVELRQKLEAIGQRSINNIVDITNLVMFELNQPMHAFDSDKVDGDINIRFAKEGEEITTLDNNEVKLSVDIPVIADDKEPLAIAGVKGGKKAEVDSQTINIILESANFDPVLVRKTSVKTGIKTDSSKRFENEITPELALKAIDRATELIFEFAGDDDTEVFEVVDNYPNPVKEKTIEVSTDRVNSLLGSELSTEDISKILNKLYFENEVSDSLIRVLIPHERLDLNMQTDVIEEIGRIYGYDKIVEQDLPDFDFEAKVNKEYGANTLIRKTLIDLGFSEVVTYSFIESGRLSPEKPIAEDKKFLRDSIKPGMQKSLELNQRNADLLGLDHINIFEIGKVFDGEPNNYYEKPVLAIGTINKQGIKKPNPATFKKQAIEKLSEIFGVEFKTKDNLENSDVIEIDLEEIYESVDPDKLLENDSYPMFPAIKNNSYNPVSQYPFVLRDIAVWLPNETSVDELTKIVKEKGGELLVREPRQFDVYQKDDRTSYAYRLVFQSYEKTLTDEEVNKIMDSINLEIESKGWEIR